MRPLDIPPAHRTSKKSGSSIEDLAKAHPDYAKWDALAGDADATSTEDALHPEHRVESSEDMARQLMRNEAMMYWLPRGISGDTNAYGWGSHRERAIELIAELKGKYGVDIALDEAIKLFEETQQVADVFYGARGAQKGQGGMAERRLEKMIDQKMRELEKENKMLADRLATAA